MMADTVDRPRVAFRLPRLDPRRLPFLALLLFIGFLVIYPIAWLLLGSFLSASPFHPGTFTLDNYIRAYSEPTILRTAGTTLVFSLGQTIAALIMGGGMAWLVARTNTPGKSLFEFSMLVLLVLPTIVSVVAWNLLMSPTRGLLNMAAMALFPFEQPPFAVYSLGTMIFVQSLATAPFAYLILAPVFAAGDSSLEEAARMSGAGPFRIFFTVTLPLARPAILSTTILVFILGIEAFDVPQLLGAPRGIYTYTSLIYHAIQVREPPEYGMATALAVSLQAMALLCVVLYRRSIKAGSRYEVIRGKGYRAALVDLGRWRWAACGIGSLFALVTIILPLVMVILVSAVPYFFGFNQAYWNNIGWANYVRLLNHPALQGAVTNSLLLAVGGGAVCVLLAAAVGVIVSRSRIPGRGLLEGVSMLPLSVPATVLAMGLLWAYIALPLPIYGTVMILLIAYVTRYLPLALRTVSGGIAAIGSELEEASRMSGAVSAETFVRITLPLAKATLLSAWLMMFMIFFREFSMSILLAGPGNTVLSVVLYDYYQSADTGMLCAASVILTFVVTGVVLIGKRFWGLRG